MAELLGVIDDYRTACEQERREHLKEVERVKQEEAKTIEHRKLIWQRAYDMYDKKQIPDPLWTKYGNRASPQVIFDYLMSQEGVANV